MNRILAGIVIISAILFSGCVSTINPVSPDDVIVDVTPIIVKEFQDKDMTISVANNGSGPIDSVKASSFDPFTLVASGSPNIPARTSEGPSQVSIDLKIQAPGFKTDINNTMLVLSYASGKNDKGETIIKTKSVPVKTIVLPDASLQFVGFVKGPENKSEAEVTSWEINKGNKATITFSVKNDGKTTIDKDTLRILVDIENKEIGSNSSMTIKEGMAKGGTSYTEALELPISKDSPNGDTDVFVTLYKGDNIIDSKTLHLKVLL
ncbi:MAG: hypothetical protein J5U19_09825 [Candidatus Methanoperedens sp.]|nr:hypothetical protein [Candidatus Methanoperedens sp.]